MHRDPLCSRVKYLGVDESKGCDWSLPAIFKMSIKLNLAQILKYCAYIHTSTRTVIAILYVYVMTSRRVSARNKI